MTELREFDPALAVLVWAAVVAVLTLLGAGVVTLAGLLTGKLSLTYGRLGTSIGELFAFSPARVWALAVLTWREAVRRRVLLVFVVFAVLFMFGSWFLNGVETRTDLLVPRFVQFVLKTIGYLLFPVSLLLACWGLPEDIRRRSLHTVVTKPVRRGEVVVGRILGYAGVMTFALLVMATIGYGWIDRSVKQIDPDARLVSRVPVFGDLRFRGSRGEPMNQGINVGDIWTYRSYVTGQTQARAIFTFEGLGENAFSTVRTAEGEEVKRLILESSFEAFRTLKGDMTRGTLVQYTFVNPKTGLRVDDPDPFPIEEFQKNVHFVPRELTVYEPDADGGEGAYKTYDILEDLIADEADVAFPDPFAPDAVKTVKMRNVMQIEVGTPDRSQYLGVGQADLFVRLADRSFASGYFKAVAGIWLMNLLVITLGVTAGSFVKGPVATVLLLSLFLVGLGRTREFLDELVTTFASGSWDGGGPVESIVRLIQHMNPITDFDPGPGVTLMKAVDSVFMGGLVAVSRVIPDFTPFALGRFPAEGFDVPFVDGLLPAIATVLAFLIPCLVVGHLALRFRELEAK
ncbi:MAG: hypothetical protein AAGJ97_03310 [Planctomycetota bacterium]